MSNKAVYQVEVRQFGSHWHARVAVAAGADPIEGFAVTQARTREGIEENTRDLIATILDADSEDDFEVEYVEFTEMRMKTAAFLVAPLVDHLWQQWEGGEGCCNECCCACIALNDLLGTGQLDELYGHYIGLCGGDAAEHLTWDAEKNQIARSWLTAAWSGPRECHELVEMLTGGTDEA